MITRKNNLFLKSFGVLLIIIPISVVLIKKMLIVNNHNQDIKAINNYIEKTSHKEETAEEKINSHQEVIDYIGILEIPDISLKKGFLSIDDKYNDVAYNIALLSSSQMPDIINSNLILAAHNGNSEVSYFKNLSKLSYNNLINVYYQGTKYIYKLHNIYEIEKSGNADIIRDCTINTLTLITCKDNSDTKQVVYIAYLISTETY